jgi:catechol 2,3-dioxygenase-like lactoylglutathione lyase family enzyme
MVALPLAHVSWALPDNSTRKACDAFFLDVFGAETAFEMLMTPEMAKAGFDREEKLMVIGDTMLIPIAPAGPGEDPNSSTGNMLRRNAGPNRWLGVALRVADLPSTDAWFRAKGFTLHYDPGMESHYFLVGRGQALGVRLELMVGELPNDPRLKPDWKPERWRDEHPLGIEGLQSIGVSVPDLDSARSLFEERLEWPEIARRRLDRDDADCASFLVGDTVIEAMQPTSGDAPVARHVRDVKGIYCLTFKVRSADAAADYLRGKGLSIIGEVSDRFAIAPEQAFDRLIYFTEQTVSGYPPLGSKITRPAEFPVLAGQA